MQALTPHEKLSLQIKASLPEQNNMNKSQPCSIFSKISLNPAIEYLHLPHIPGAHYPLSVMGGSRSYHFYSSPQLVTDNAQQIFAIPLSTPVETVGLYFIQLISETCDFRLEQPQERA